MLIPLLGVTAIVVFSTICNAIALFTSGWAYFSVPIGYLNNDFSIGLVPFDSTAYGWFVATCVFMYLSFTLELICCLICIFGLMIFFARRDGSLASTVFISIGVASLLAALSASITFIIFVANYQDVNLDYDYGGLLVDVSIGFSPFIALLAIILAIIATGVAGFFAIAAMNRQEEGGY